MLDFLALDPRGKTAVISVVIVVAGLTFVIGATEGVVDTALVVEVVVVAAADVRFSDTVVDGGAVDEIVCCSDVVALFVFSRPRNRFRLMFSRLTLSREKLFFTPTIFF